MNEKNVMSEIDLLKERIDKMENALKNFVDMQIATQDIEEVEDFYWKYDSENVFPNAYPRDAEDNFLWLGPQPMTRLSFFLKKENMYRIELNISSLPPTISPESVKIIVDKEVLTISRPQDNLYVSLFNSGLNQGLTSIFFGIEHAVNPSKLGLGLDTRDLSIALHSISLKKDD